jgi:hypothetical protein
LFEKRTLNPDSQKIPMCIVLFLSVYDSVFAS